MKSKDGRDSGTLSRIREAAYRKPNQSPLLRWFQRNHAEFAAIMARPQKPGWDTIAAELTADGIAMENGKSITAAYARHTWWKVQKARGGASPAKPVQRITAPIKQPPIQVMPHDEADDEAPTRPTFRTAGGLKNWPSANPEAPAAPAQPPIQPPRPAPAFDPFETADEPRPTPRFGISKLRD